MDAAFGEILKLGVSGAFIVILLLALRSRDASYREVQDKRILESQANTERFLTALGASNENGRETVKALGNIQTVIQAMTTSFNDMKKAFEDGGGPRGGRK